jgi:hypothetical protein
LAKVSDSLYEKPWRNIPEDAMLIYADSVRHRRRCAKLAVEYFRSEAHKRAEETERIRLFKEDLEAVERQIIEFGGTPPERVISLDTNTTTVWDIRRQTVVARNHLHGLRLGGAASQAVFLGLEADYRRALQEIDLSEAASKVYLQDSNQIGDVNHVAMVDVVVSGAGLGGSYPGDRKATNPRRVRFFKRHLCGKATGMIWQLLRRKNGAEDSGLGDQKLPVSEAEAVALGTTNDCTEKKWLVEAASTATSTEVTTEKIAGVWMAVYEITIDPNVAGGYWALSKLGDFVSERADRSDSRLTRMHHGPQTDQKLEDMVSVSDANFCHELTQKDKKMFNLIDLVNLSNYFHMVELTNLLELKISTHLLEPVTEEERTKARLAVIQLFAFWYGDPSDTTLTTDDKNQPEELSSPARFEHEIHTMVSRMRLGEEASYTSPDVRPAQAYGFTRKHYNDLYRSNSWALRRTP